MSNLEDKMIPETGKGKRGGGVPSEPPTRSSLYLQYMRVFGEVAPEYGLHVRQGGSWANLTLLVPSIVVWEGVTQTRLVPGDPGDVATVKRVERFLNDPRTKSILKFSKDNPYPYDVLRLLLDKPGGVSELSQIFQGRQDTYTRLGSPTGNPGAWDYFVPEGLPGTSISDEILSWLPPTERRVLMLCIGRIVSGDTISPWRTVPLITGRPGLGKTRFLARLEFVLSQLGHTASHVQSPVSRFSLNRELVNSQLLITDDTTTSDLKSLISNSVFKSLVTGAKTVIEEKFHTPFSAYSNAVYFILGNGILPSDLIGADPGVISRIFLLQCKDDTASTCKILSDMSERLGITEVALMELLVKEALATYERVADMEKEIQTLRTTSVLPSPSLSLAELAIAAAYCHKRYTGCTPEEALENWSFSTILDCAEVELLEVPKSITSLFVEVNWKACCISLMKAILHSRPTPKNVTQYFSTRSGTSLPSTLAPYRRAVEVDDTKINALLAAYNEVFMD